MRFSKSLIDFFLYFFNRENGLYDFSKIATSLFGPDQRAIPKTLQNSYKREIYQGLINSRVIPNKLDTIWPYWVFQQLLPGSSHFCSSVTPQLLNNVTHRNWTTLGYPGTDDKPIIDPRGLLTPHNNGWSLDIWIANSSKILSPATLKSVSQTCDTQSPKVETQFSISNIQITTTSFYKSSREIDNLIYNKVHIQNKSKKTLSFSVVLAIRPYNPLGLSPIKDITYLTSNAFIVNDQLGVVLDQAPDNIICLAYEDMDILSSFSQWEMIVQTQCKDHLASGFAEYRITLTPGEIKTLTYKVPAKSTHKMHHFFQKALNPNQQKQLQSRINQIRSQSFDKTVQVYNQEWKSVSKTLAKVVLPDADLTNLFQTNMTHLQNFLGKKGIYQGGFSYKHIHIPDMFQSLLSLNRIGGMVYSKELIKLCLRNRSNFQLVAKSQATSAQAITTILDTFSFTQDTDFLESIFPLVHRLTSGLIKRSFGRVFSASSMPKLFQTPLTNNRQSLHHVELIHAVWSYAGIRAAVKLATLSNREEKLESWTIAEEKIYVALQGMLDRIPSHIEIGSPSPFQPGFGLITELLGVYPLQVIGADNPVITRFLDYLKTSQHTIDPAYYQFSGHPGFGITQNCQLAQVYLQRRDAHSLKLLRWVVDHASSTGCWPEMVHPVSGGGMVGDGHFSTASSAFISLLRNHLVREDHFTLILTPMIPVEWLDQKESISLTAFPTLFGSLDMVLSFSENEATLKLNHHFHTKPKMIKIVLPKFIHKIKIGQVEKTVEGHEVEIPLQANLVTFTFSSVV